SETLRNVSQRFDLPTHTLPQLGEYGFIDDRFRRKRSAGIRPAIGPQPRAKQLLQISFAERFDQVIVHDCFMSLSSLVGLNVSRHGHDGYAPGQQLACAASGRSEDHTSELQSRENL